MKHAGSLASVFSEHEHTTFWKALQAPIKDQPYADSAAPQEWHSNPTPSRRQGDVPTV